MRLVLASASPRRAELLKAAGYSFETLAVELDERRHAREPPVDYVRRLAREKATRALELLQGPPRTSTDVVVLGADTAVVVDGDVLGKPRDDADARAMLQRLSGRSHEVMTGVALKTPEGLVDCVATTTVWFASLSDEAIDWYVATAEGRDKAGAYAIQGLASRYIRRIDGSYSNVVGLPVAAVTELMNQMANKSRFRQT